MCSMAFDLTSAVHGLPVLPLQCYGVIYGYMGFAGFNIFFFLSGTLTLKLFQAFHLHLDAFTFVYVLYNFAVCGTKASVPCFP